MASRPIPFRYRQLYSGLQYSLTMNFKATFGLILMISCMFLSAPGFSDDSAAAIAAGGLVPRRETRIVMAKEVLQISEKKIVVDYDFRNDSDEDVTTEVAFPVPPYSEDWMEENLASQSFADFQLWIDGKPTKFHAEAKAFLHHHDVTQILARYGVDVASFGHSKDRPGPYERIEMSDIDRLPKAEQTKLQTLGLVDLDSDMPTANWTVHLQYHWTQVFPAHSITHVRHEYTPAAGYQQIQLEAFKSVLARPERKAKPLTKGRSQDEYDLLSSFCPDDSFLRGMIHAVKQQPLDSGDYAPLEWVDFILTSANTWQRPIEDFTLIVDRPSSQNGEHSIVSFCSPGSAKVEKTDANHFQVHLTNFIPTSELHIGFFDVPQARPAKVVSSKR